MGANEPRRFTKSLRSHSSTSHIATQISQYASPLGLLLIQHNGQFIQQLRYGTVDNTTYSSLPTVWQQHLDDYFAGDFDALEQLPVQLNTGTVFQQSVWHALRQVKAGQTSSYIQLARSIDRPKASRAIGQALKKNPIPLILPCHRIIQQSGKLGGYEGDALLSSGRKQFLLWHEGALPLHT